MDIKVLSSGSKGNCYVLDDGHTFLLIECGIPWAKIQQHLGFRSCLVEGCLLSHEHNDHARAARGVLRAGIPIFTSEGTIKALGLPQYGRVRDEQDRRDFDAWHVQGFPVEHDAAEPWGFVVENGGEKLVYLTDTAYSRYRFPGVTTFMVEANYGIDILRRNLKGGEIDQGQINRLLHTHMSIETCKQLLLANDLSKCRAIHLLHLSDSNSDAELFKRTIEEATGVPTYIA
jgi:phosphoribosyl 1,2-cyclic phosphodiesterase